MAEVRNFNLFPLLPMNDLYKLDVSEQTTSTERILILFRCMYDV